MLWVYTVGRDAYIPPRDGLIYVLGVHRMGTYLPVWSAQNYRNGQDRSLPRPNNAYVSQN